MTVKDIERLNADVLTPTQVADVLGCNAYSINLQVQDNAVALGFPAIKIGSRVRIPKDAFVRFMHGDLPVGGSGCAECTGQAGYAQAQSGHKYCAACGKRLSYEAVT